MSYSLATGKSSYPIRTAQLQDVGLIVNGYTANAILDMRTGQIKTLGMAAPGAAPTGAANGAGVLGGTYSWRVRWYDSSTDTLSLPSALYTATPAAQTWRLTRPGSPPARASHWILERTTDGGSTYYPVNQDLTNPNGTLIATTIYDDNISDSTLRNRQSYPENQGQPPIYAFCLVNGVNLFMGGGLLHQFAANVTNASASVTAAAGTFTSDMVGMDFAVTTDTDGKSYVVSAFVNSGQITLAENYAGVNATAIPAKLAGLRDRYAWCDNAEPESWGSAAIGGLSNELRAGDDGEPIQSMIGMGTGGVLICKNTRMYMHSYRDDPQLEALGGDGRQIPLQIRRGALGFHSARRFDQYVYGMDVFGIWRMAPGGEPQEIGKAIQNDYRSLNFTQSDKFWIGFDGLFRRVYFFVVETGQTYPKKSYIWDIDREAFVDMISWPWEVPSGVELPDNNGALRLMIWSAKTGNALAYAWFEGIGTTAGVAPGVTPMTGVLLAGTATSLTQTGTTWPTTGEGLAGVPVKVIRGTQSETQVVTNNTDDTLFTTPFTTMTPTALDTFILGVMESSWKTGRINPDATRKKRFIRLYVWLRYDTSAIDLKCRVYYDGNPTPFADRLTMSEDGVSTTAGEAPVGLDPTVSENRYYVPLGQQWADDVQIEFYSDKPGRAWEIMAVSLEYELDPNDDPAKK